MEATGIMSSASTETLVAAATELDGKTERTETERMSLAWVTDELLRRHPEATAATEAWADDLDTTASYTETVLAAISKAHA